MDHAAATGLASGQIGNRGTGHMKRSTLTASIAAWLCLGVVVPLRAAPPTTTPVAAPPTATPEAAPATGMATSAPPSGASVAVTPSPDKCLADLSAFDQQMEKDGYWLGASGYGYGYPMGGYGYGYGMGAVPMRAVVPGSGVVPAAPVAGANPAGAANPAGIRGRYWDARPGHEVRMLVASANILARHGQGQACEEVLATGRDIYKVYVTDMRSGKYPVADVPNWRRQQIAAAQPVTSTTTSFRSDELLGTDVRDTKDRALGSVDDLVMSPQSGKIAYLLIARGGLFGFDQKYVAVPWEDFKITPNSNVLVLDTTKAALDGAPQASHDQFATPGNFDQQSQTVDAYWKAHITDKG
jgi:sporulation protein YlmC with PRC-barrel domain